MSNMIRNFAKGFQNNSLVLTGRRLLLVWSPNLMSASRVIQLRKTQGIVKRGGNRKDTA